MLSQLELDFAATDPAVNDEKEEDKMSRIFQGKLANYEDVKTFDMQKLTAQSLTQNNNQQLVVSHALALPYPCTDKFDVA